VPHRRPEAGRIATVRHFALAAVYEIDDVIDLAGTRHWIRAVLRDVPRGERRIPLDTW
jgi:hypothetical protein